MTESTAEEDARRGVTAGEVQVRIADGVGTLEFHHPKGNSLPGLLLRRLASEIAALGADDAVRVIVLRSGGTGPFCAGASFDELTRVSTPEEGREFFSGFSRVILAMIRAPKFVVTRVQGKAAGGAVGLIAASDYAMAVSGASARLSELAVGIGPFIVGAVIEKKIGLAGFSAMAVDADWREGAWCERQGLYARVCENVFELDSAVARLAGALAASNPEAMRELKRIFWAGTEGWDQLLDERARMSGRMVLSEFTRRAIHEFSGQ
jgi:methylglutaconyl-CoA hydratase